MAISIKKAVTSIKAKAVKAVKDNLIMGKRGPVDPVDLSRAQKRAQRDEAQRIHAQAKERLRAMLARMQDARRKTGKVYLKPRKRGGYTTKLERAMMHDMEEATYQSGKAVVGGVAAAATSAAAIHLARSFGSISQTLDSVSTSATSLMTTVETALSNFVDTIKSWGWILWEVALGAVLLWLANKFIGVPGVTLILFGFAAKYVPKLSSHIFGHDVVHEQAGVSEAATLLAMMCTCWVPGKDTKSVTGEFMKRVSHFPRASEGFESFITKALGMFESFVNFVMQRGEDNKIRFITETNAFKQWVSKTISYMRKMAEEVVLSMEDLRKIREHYLMGFGFHEILVTDDSKRELKMWMEKLALALRPHEGAITKMSNVRPMPVCIMLGGDSGVGKTSLVRFVASLVLLLSGEVKASEALSHLWQKGTTQYWNGWVGQKCLVIDDAFQVKGKPGDMDSEAMQMIRAIGNWAYPLNFADLESKGKYYLNTPLIIGTTNCMNVRDEWKPFLTQPDALVRRFQYAYWVSLNDAYKDDNGRLDYGKLQETVNQRVQDMLKRTAQGEKFTEEHIMDIVPWEAWGLVPHDFCGDVDRRGSRESLKNLVRTVADAVHSRKVTNDIEINDLDAILDLLEKTRQSETVREQVLSESFKALRPRYAKSEVSFTSADVADTIALMKSADVVLTSEPQNDHYGEIQDDMEECPLPELVSSHDIDFTEKTQRGTKYYGRLDEAMKKEREHRGILVSMRNQVLKWQDNLYEVVMGSKMNLGSPLGLFKVFSFGCLMGFAVNMAINAVKLVGQVLGKLLGFRPSSAVKEQSNAGNGVKTKAKSKFTFATIDDIISPAKLQVGTPPHEGAADKVYNNTFKMVVTNGEQHIPLGQAIGLGSDVFIFPQHFLRELKGDYKGWGLTFYHAKPTSEYKFQMTVEEFLRLKMVQPEGFDIAAVAFGNAGVKCVQRIDHLFLTQSAIGQRMRGRNNQVNIQVFNFDLVDGKVVKQRDRLCSSTCESMDAPLRTEKGNVLQGLVKYHAPTREGDCGAPVLLTEEPGACILGFHTAGRTVSGVREGFGTVVSREVAVSLYQRLRGYEDLIDRAPLVPLDQKTEEAVTQSGLVGGSMYLIGKLDKPLSQATASKLRPSIMQAERVLGEPVSDVAILRPVRLDDRIVYPAARAIEAYQSDQVYMDPRILEPVVEMAMQKHWSATNGEMAEVLSFEEAVQPPETLKLKPMNRKTSPGFKYRDYVTPRTPGKTFALGYDGEVDFTKRHFINEFGDPDWEYTNAGLQKLADDVQMLIYEAHKGRRTMHLCVDFLKDELRPLEKVKAVKTRAISGTEMDYTVAVRMYFGAFMAASFKTHVYNGMAPGINHYTEWGVLAEELLKKGDSLFDGDFSRFDASEQPWIHEAILQYINRWYRRSPHWTQEDEDVRNILWLDLVHSRHISGMSNTLDLVVQWNKSLPSGHPLTTIVNSMYSLITLAGCYVSIVGAYNMWDHCFVNTFGDDNIVSVDEQTRDVFNQVSVAREMKALFNLDYTAGNKSGKLVPWTDIQSVTFLKRSFAPDEAGDAVIAKTPFVGWVAPLDTNSFLYEGYWYRNQRNPMEDVQERLSHTMYELSLHPVELWDRYAPTIITWAESKNLDIPYKTRAACRHYIKTRFDVWF